MLSIKKNYKITFIILCLIFSNSFPQSSGFVSTKGKQIITPDGKELFLKGINLGNWLEPEGYMFEFKNAESSRKIYEVINELIGPEAAYKFWETFRKNYITENDIKFIKDHGFNSVRIPFDYKLFTHEDFSPDCSQPGFSFMDSVIAWCSRNKIYAVLDMHIAPGGQTGANIDDSWGYPFLYNSPESQELTIKIWKEVAARYKNEKYVLGYDLLNEPIAHYFDAKEFNHLLEPLYMRITKGIRQVDTNHIIILGGAQWDTNFKIFGKPFDPKLVYTFHTYWSDTTRKVIQQFLDFRDKYNVPIWLGESGENTMQWINSFRKLLERNDIGWCFWTFKRLDTDRSIVSIKKTGDYEAIKKFADSNRQTFEDIRKNTPDRKIVLKALEEYLINIKLDNCNINTEYIKALGL